MDFTVVLGVDQKTIHSLKLVWPTWVAHKPSLLNCPFVIFIDGVDIRSIDAIIGIPAKYVSWPQPHTIEYPRDGLTKWTNPQRAKMLAGFVHVPAWYVQTPYWLKLDLDAIATGKNNWVDLSWFDGNPSIIAPGWSYTKPADQMLKLDSWVEQNNMDIFKGTDPLNLVPDVGSDIVKHPRIASWCAFFSTEFTKICSKISEETVGPCQIPVDSQDGVMFYIAKRAGFSIRTVKMKRYGWTYRSSLNQVQLKVSEVLH